MKRFFTMQTHAASRQAYGSPLRTQSAPPHRPLALLLPPPLIAGSRRKSFLRRSFATLIGALFFSLTLAGCLDYEQETWLAEDGSGRMEVHYWMSESMLVWLKDGTLTFNEDSVRHRYAAKGIEVQDVRVFTRAEDSTRHVEAALRFDDITALPACKSFEEVTFRWMREGDVYRFEQSIPIDSGSEEAFLEQFSFVYTYHFPGSVRESNADSISGSTAVWSFKLSELTSSESLTAIVEAPSGQNIWWVLGVVAVVVVLIIVLAVMRRKRKLAV